MKKLLVSYVLLLTACFCKAQQDPQYSQYMFNQLVINPAYAGSKEALSAVIDGRYQWLAMPGAPKTCTMSLYGQLLNSLGIGGHLIAENIGPTTWTAAYIDLAYRFKLGRGKLSFGVSGGLVNYNINVSQLNYKDPGEPILNYSGPRNAFDVNAGFYYHSQSFYIGGSATHINSPNLYKDNSTVYIANIPKNASLYFSLQSHYFLYAGKGFRINDDLVFNPSIMVKAIGTGLMPSVDLNANFLLKNRVWLGVSARSGYGFVGLFQIYVTDKFKVGYAYDQGLNRIGIQGQSSHEIMLSYDFNNFKTKMLSPRYL
jgi:type IX secretion system PorP/SprF family membrane protein